MARVISWRRFGALIGVAAVVVSLGAQASAISGVVSAVELSPVAGTPASALGSLAYRPDGRWLVASEPDAKALFVYSVSPGTGRLRRADGSPVRYGRAGLGLAFSPDGRLLATANSSRSVSVFRVGQRTGVLHQVRRSPFWTGTGGNARAVAFSPDGRLLAAANDSNGNVSVFSVAHSGALKRVHGSPFSTGHGSHPAALAFSRDGRFLAVNNGYQLEMFQVHRGSGRLTASPGSPYFISDSLAAQSVAFSPNGRFVAGVYFFPAATSDPPAETAIAVFAVDPHTGRLTQIPGSPFAASGNYWSTVTYSPGGHLLAASGMQGASLTLFTVAADGSLAPIASAPGSFDSFLAFDPTGGLLASTGIRRLSEFTVRPPDR